MADLTCKEALRLLLDQVDFTRKACSPTDMVGACIPKEVFDKCHKAIYDELSPRQALDLLDQAKGMLQHTRCKDEDASQCPACGLEATIEMYLSRTKKVTSPAQDLAKAQELSDERKKDAEYINRLSIELVVGAGNKIVELESALAAEERERAAREALRALVDRNITFDGANAILPFETHDQAINHIEEARDIANAALRAGERT